MTDESGCGVRTPRSCLRFHGRFNQLGRWDSPPPHSSLGDPASNPDILLALLPQGELRGLGDAYSMPLRQLAAQIRLAGAPRQEDAPVQSIEEQLARARDTSSSTGGPSRELKDCPDGDLFHVQTAQDLAKCNSQDGANNLLALRMHNSLCVLITGIANCNSQDKDQQSVGFGYA